MKQSDIRSKISEFHKTLSLIRKEYAKVIIGNEIILNKLMMALLCRGHVLIEGFPGLAKTLIVKTLSQISGCKFSRVQFTPDLLPGDITGVMTYDEVQKFHIMKGPIFANFVLADEINRASPKVQSALLESMQERQATIGNHTYLLPKPFFVIATQNPVENLGTYNLPEAQVDRFIFKLIISYPSKNEEEFILENNSTTKDFKHFDVQKVIDAQTIIDLQKIIHHIYVKPSLKKYIVGIIDATRNPKEYGLETHKYIQLGVSPRASIALFIAAKAHALVTGKSYITPHDIKMVAPDILRHRLALNYEAQVDNVSVEKIVSEILKKVPIP